MCGRSAPAWWPSPRPRPGTTPPALPPSAPYTGGGLEPATLLAPPSDSWPTYHGDYSGRRHSKLSAITPDNVGRLTLAWTFQTGQTDSIKAVPLVFNGIAYVTTPDNMWAVDIRNGRQIWHYTYPKNLGFHIGHRGAAMYKGTVYLTTPDAHLVALDARTGRLKWNMVIGDYKKGYWSTNAPLLIRDHLIVGVSGDFDNLPGMLKAFDPETGEEQWTFYSTPPPGTPGSISGGATGGQMWNTGTYDPDLNLLFVGTGNPTPVLNGPARPGDNPWICSILAINPDTGKLAWGFQASPHDTHDWDAAEVPVLVDATFKGEPRKMLLQASRNGYYFVLDRTTGKSLLTTPFATVNWASGIDKDGRPDAQSREGAVTQRQPGGARRGWRHQLPIAQLRSEDRPLHRQRARRLCALLLQGRARKLRMGGRRLRRHQQGLHSRPRLPDRPGPLEPRDRRRRRRGRADHRHRRHLHRRRIRQRARAADERRDRRCGTRRSAAWATRRSPSRSTATSI